MSDARLQGCKAEGKRVLYQIRFFTPYESLTTEVAATRNLACLSRYAAVPDGPASLTHHATQSAARSAPRRL